jgi:hypothetical protein
MRHFDDARRSVLERYETDSNFRLLVDMLINEIMRGRYTPSELREAVILAATQSEFMTVRNQIICRDNFNIEDTVLRCVADKIKGNNNDRSSDSGM